LQNNSWFCVQKLSGIGYLSGMRLATCPPVQAENRQSVPNYRSRYLRPPSSFVCANSVHPGVTSSHHVSFLRPWRPLRFSLVCALRKIRSAVVRPPVFDVSTFHLSFRDVVFTAIPYFAVWFGKYQESMFVCSLL